MNISFAHLKISSSNWSVETILNSIKSGRLVVNCSSSRYGIWNNSIKSKYIETLILGLPTGALTIGQFPTDSVLHAVLDGSQRAATLLEFYGQSASANNNFALKNLEFLDNLEGKTRLDIASMLPREQDVLKGLEIQTIRVDRIAGIVNKTEDKDLLTTIASGLNFSTSPRTKKDRMSSLFPPKFFSYN